MALDDTPGCDWPGNFQQYDDVSSLQLRLNGNNVDALGNPCRLASNHKRVLDMRIRICAVFLTEQIEIIVWDIQSLGKLVRKSGLAAARPTNDVNLLHSVLPCMRW